MGRNPPCTLIHLHASVSRFRLIVFSRHYWLSLGVEGGEGKRRNGKRGMRGSVIPLLSRPLYQIIPS